MIVDLNGVKVKLIGDPHLGRQFVSGVPLHRRGERETQQFEQFINELFKAETDTVIIMGDLFDKFIVPPEVVLNAMAAIINCEKYVIILAGNHDLSKDVTKKSSFDLLAAMVKYWPKTTIVKKEPIHINLDGETILVIPYSPHKTSIDALEMVEEGKAKVAFGHWDVTIQGDNFIPAKRLKELGIEIAYTGHEHTPTSKVIDGLEVVVTGSMQPYSHGEDPKGDLYVTVSLDEVMKDPSAFKDKCVRLKVEPGQAVPNIDARQLTVMPTAKDEAGKTIHVDIETFNFDTLFKTTMGKEGVSSDLITHLLEVYHDPQA